MKGKHLGGVGGSTEERNDREGNNRIPDAGTKQIIEGCTKKNEELECTI